MTRRQWPHGSGNRTRAGSSFWPPLYPFALGPQDDAGLTRFSKITVAPGAKDRSVALNIKARGSNLVALHIPARRTVTGGRFLIVQLHANQAVAESDFANDTLVSLSAVTFA